MMGRGRNHIRARCLHGGLLLAVLAFAFAALARPAAASPQASTGSIAGKVSVTSADGTPSVLPGVTVKLTPSTAGAASQAVLTNSDGHYEFTHLTPGSYTIDVSVDGFKPWTASVTLTAGQAAAEDAALELSSLEEKVEVQGEATEIATQSVSAAATVSEQQLETLPLKTGKFTEALSVSPSVIRTQEGRLNFNGQAESQGMLLVDSAENVDPVSGSFGIPIPVDAIQSIKVFSTPDSPTYGGFSGGLTTIEIRPPVPNWNYKILEFLPSFRAKNDSLVGIANFTPRIEVGGPLVKNKLNFSEDLGYEFRRDPVRGLTWPFNETYTHSFNSFTEFQYTISPKHLLNVNVNFFPSTNLYSNITALIPQTASVNFHRRGISVGASDDYQFDSGMVLNTVVRYTNYYSNAQGQGPADMTISPTGWGGNFFNAWWRNANQVEILPALQLPSKSWLGTHELKFGVDLLYREFDASSVSHPLNLLDQNSVAAETIHFQGPGSLNVRGVELSEFVEDHWTLTKRLSITYGARATSQSNGAALAFSPRAGVAYSLAGGRIVLRGGAGMIQGHVPLLAVDFADNQVRVLNFLSGPMAGRTITLQNLYFPATGTVPVGPDDLGNSPRTFTWNLESEFQVRKNFVIRASYYETHTRDLFFVNPVLPVSGSNGTLELRNTGSSHYRQAEVSGRYRPSERAELNISYSWSQARGDLNTLSDTFIPFQAPVLRPNLYGTQPSDIPNRAIAWGFVHIPWNFVVSPVADMHTGFAYSNVDIFQNYVGAPYSLRYPVYFSLDVKVYKDFSFSLPFGDRSKKRKIRLGVYSLDVTNRQNPHDVFNNTALPAPNSALPGPFFGEFAGFQRRFTGLAIGLGQ
ncbi:MAG: TonB-dependent receptor [Acidobacteriia bacterium]|nr:TonB-dependent receptor [Terriglobia bacterium]